MKTKALPMIPKFSRKLIFVGFLNTTLTPFAQTRTAFFHALIYTPLVVEKVLQKRE